MVPKNSSKGEYRAYNTQSAFLHAHSTKVFYTTLH